MLIQHNNRKPTLDFLVSRWLLISKLAAVERVYNAACKFAQQHNHPVPLKPVIVEAQPSRQIEIIKQYIIKILPEARFIDYTYEAQAPLDPNDFVELYLEDHAQCVGKVQSLMERMKIT